MYFINFSLFLFTENANHNVVLKQHTYIEEDKYDRKANIARDCDRCNSNFGYVIYFVNKNIKSIILYLFA